MLVCRYKEVRDTVYTSQGLLLAGGGGGETTNKWFYLVPWAIERQKQDLSCSVRWSVGGAPLSVREMKEEGHRGRGEAGEMVVLGREWEWEKAGREKKEKREKEERKEEKRATMNRNLAYLESSLSSGCLRRCMEGAEWWVREPGR